MDGILDKLKEEEIKVLNGEARPNAVLLKISSYIFESLQILQSLYYSRLYLMKYHTDIVLFLPHYETSD